MRKLLLVFLTILAFLLLDFSSVLSQDIKIGTGRAKRVLFIGDSISIWWSVENATKFSCAELEEFDLPMEGKLFVSPKQSTNYVFVAERGKSSKSKRIAIEVVHPEIVNFNVPANITDEGTYSISWDAINCDYVKIAGIDKKFPIEGRHEFKSTKDTSVHISACNNSGYCDKQSKRAKVKYIESIAATEKIDIGDLVKVEWKYKNAQKIAITGVSDNLPPIGSKNISAKDSYSYEVLIYRDDGTIDESFFNVQVVQPKILFFDGNTVVRPDEEVNLTWACENVDSVTLSIDPGKKFPANFKYSFKPEKSGEIRLGAWLNGFLVSDTLKIEINTYGDY